MSVPTSIPPARPPRLPHNVPHRNPDSSQVKRLYAKVTPEFHYRVQLKALQSRRDISDIIRELVAAWLEEPLPSDRPIS